MTPYERVRLTKVERALVANQKALTAIADALDDLRAEGGCAREEIETIRDSVNTMRRHLKPRTDSDEPAGKDT